MNSSGTCVPSGQGGEPGRCEACGSAGTLARTNHGFFVCRQCGVEQSAPPLFQGAPRSVAREKYPSPRHEPLLGGAGCRYLGAPGERAGGGYTRLARVDGWAGEPRSKREGFVEVRRVCSALDLPGAVSRVARVYLSAAWDGARRGSRCRSPNLLAIASVLRACQSLGVVVMARELAGQVDRTMWAPRDLEAVLLESRSLFPRPSPGQGRRYVAKLVERVVGVVAEEQELPSSDARALLVAARWLLREHGTRLLVPTKAGVAAASVAALASITSKLSTRVPISKFAAAGGTTPGSVQAYLGRVLERKFGLSLSGGVVRSMGVIRSFFGR
ncbi:MAG: cyclin family protein [Promethearchaeota archaeon]